MIGACRHSSFFVKTGRGNSCPFLVIRAEVPECDAGRHSQGHCGRKEALIHTHCIIIPDPLCQSEPKDAVRDTVEGFLKAHTLHHPHLFCTNYTQSTQFTQSTQSTHSASPPPALPSPNPWGLIWGELHLLPPACGCVLLPACTWHMPRHLMLHLTLREVHHHLRIPALTLCPVTQYIRHGG